MRFSASPRGQRRSLHFMTGEGGLPLLRRRTSNSESVHLRSSPAKSVLSYSHEDLSSASSAWRSRSTMCQSAGRSVMSKEQHAGGAATAEYMYM